MAKFTLGPAAQPGDPFGDDKPVVVDVSSGSATAAAGSFRFAENNFLPDTSLPVAVPRPFLDDDVPLSPEMRLVKINLAPVTARDDFAGIGDVAPSARFDKMNLAAAQTENYFDLPASSPGHEPEAGFTKNDAGDFHKFCRFTKVQETDDGDILVWGICTLEQPDLDGEICDYDAAKDAYQQWSLAAVQRTSAAGQQISLGNIRHQHSIEPAGKATKIQYNDDDKEIWLGSVPISDDIRNQLQQGFLTGYSQGGSYAWRKCTECGKNLTLQQANNFCPACKKSVPVRFGLKRVSEVSYVDAPCTGKGFEYVKNDGTSRFVSFTKRTEPSQPARGAQILDSVRVFGNVWKHTVQIADRKRLVLMRGDDIVLVA